MMSTGDPIDSNQKTTEEGDSALRANIDIT